MTSSSSSSSSSSSGRISCNSSTSQVTLCPWKHANWSHSPCPIFPANYGWSTSIQWHSSNMRELQSIHSKSQRHSSKNKTKITSLVDFVDFLLSQQHPSPKIHQQITSIHPSIHPSQSQIQNISRKNKKNGGNKTVLDCFCCTFKVDTLGGMSEPIDATWAVVGRIGEDHRIVWHAGNHVMPSILKCFKMLDLWPDLFLTSWSTIGRTTTKSWSLEHDDL